jgi:hypothetical protein
VAFVHLVCGDVLTAQRDGPPLGGLYPFDLWPPGQRWGETRLIALPPDAAESCVVNVGLYNPETGVRVPLEDGGEFVTAAVQR